MMKVMGASIVGEYEDLWCVVVSFELNTVTMARRIKSKVDRALILARILSV